MITLIFDVESGDFSNQGFPNGLSMKLNRVRPHIPELGTVTKSTPGLSGVVESIPFQKIRHHAPSRPRHRFRVIRGTQIPAAPSTGTIVE